jgi:hypothetical protein
MPEQKKTLKIYKNFCCSFLHDFSTILLRDTLSKKLFFFVHVRYENYSPYEQLPKGKKNWRRSTQRSNLRLPRYDHAVVTYRTIQYLYLGSQEREKCLVASGKVGRWGRGGGLLVTSPPGGIIGDYLPKTIVGDFPAGNCR